MLEVTDAVVDAWSADRVGVRISPVGSFNGIEDPEGADAGLFVAGELGRAGWRSCTCPSPTGSAAPELGDDYRRALREAYPGPIVGAGNYDLAKAERVLERGLGRRGRLRPVVHRQPRPAAPPGRGAAPQPARPETFYGGDAERLHRLPGVRRGLSPLHRCGA